MSTPAEHEPGTIPRRAWTDAHGDEIVLATTSSRGWLQLLSITMTGGAKARLELDSRQLREIATDMLERADALDNVPGRYRRTWRWHHREGEKALTQARTDPAAAVLIQRAQAHFLAAQVLQGHPAIQAARSVADYAAALATSADTLPAPEVARQLHGLLGQPPNGHQTTCPVNHNEQSGKDTE